MHGLNLLFLAAAASAGSLDAIDVRRLECLRARIASGGDTSLCFRLTASQRSYVESRRDEFCAHPDQFCDRMEPKEAAARAELRSRFVTPRCEAPLPACEDMRADGKGGSFLDCASLDEDREFTAIARRSWGCDGGRNAVRTGPRGPEVVRRFSCDPAKTAFDCATGRVRPASGEPVDRRDELTRRSRARAAESSLETVGASLRMEGGRCILDAPDFSPTLMMVVTHLPDVRRGETYEQYSARLNEDQRGELRERTALARRRAGRAFRVTTELLGDGRGRFEMIARGLITEERVRMAEDSYAAARRGVLEYLRTLSPPPPTAVTAAIENTQLSDLRAFARGPACEAERAAGNPSAACVADLETIRHVSEACSSSGRAFGDVNACNHTHPGQGSRVTVCPAMLLTSEATNPRFLVSVLAHELGHSIDPCSIAMMEPSVRACVTPAPAELPGLPGEAPELARWNDRLQGPTGWAACATTRAPHYTGISAGNAVYSERVFRAMIADGERCGHLDSESRCYVNSGLVTGPMRHCFRNPGTLIMDEHDCPTAHPLGMGHGAQLSSDISISTVREGYADFIASRALPRALEAFTPALSAMEPAERMAEILTTMPFYCGSDGWDDTHPAGGTRAGIFASSPEIRSAVGCVPAAAATSEDLPTARCGGLFDRGEAFVTAPTGGGS